LAGCVDDVEDGARLGSDEDEPALVDADGREPAGELGRAEELPAA
jgi:hypothetical protein